MKLVEFLPLAKLPFLFCLLRSGFWLQPQKNVTSVSSHEKIYMNFLMIIESHTSLYAKKICGQVHTHPSKNPNSAGTDALVGIERLQFSDTSLALDLDCHAGQTAKLLGAVFGAASMAHQQFVGIGLSFLDAGTSYEQLAGMAVGAAGKTSHTNVVNQLWTNLVGSAPSQAAPIVALLDGGMSVGALTVLAADLDLNTTNIGLVGLVQTGIEYSL